MKINREDLLLNHYLGSKVKITFKDGSEKIGILNYQNRKWYPARYKLDYVEPYHNCCFVFYKSNVKKIDLIM